jgi:hypothetical protein
MARLSHGILKPETRRVNRMPGITPAGPGWFELLCLLLLVVQPLRIGLTASSSLDAVMLGGAPVIVMLCIRVLVGALGFAAGIALLSRRSIGVPLAKAALVTSGATDLFVLLTPYVPSNRAPGETPFLVAASLTYHAGWLLYLIRSRTVHRILAGSE